MAVPKNKVSVSRIRIKKKLKIFSLQKFLNFAKICIYCKASKYKDSDTSNISSNHLVIKNFTCRSCVNNILTINKRLKKALLKNNKK